MNKLVLAIVALIMGLCGPAGAGARAKEPMPTLLSARQIEALEHNTYAAPSGAVLSAVVVALHARNFINIKANRDVGTVSADYLIEDNSFYSAVFGEGSLWRANILVQKGAAGESIVALKLLALTTEGGGIFGLFGDDDVPSGGPPVGVAKPYKEIYAAIDTELARVRALDSPAKVAATTDAALVAAAQAGLVPGRAPH